MDPQLWRPVVLIENNHTQFEIISEKLKFINETRLK